MTTAPPATPFPVPVGPIEGEVLTSWYVRLAHGHGEKLNSFGRRLLGRGRQVSKSDIDRAQWQELLDLLSQRTSIAAGALRAMTLLRYEGFLWGELPARGPTRWILPVTLGQSLARQGTLQFCGVCLASDEVPYFRLDWRLAFFVWCPEHRTLMQDCCGQCGAPVRLHQSDVRRSLVGVDSGLLNCDVCGADRRAYVGAACGAHNLAGFDLQVRLIDVLHAGYGAIGELDVHSIPLFHGMAIIWSLLDDRARSARLWSVLGSQGVPDACDVPTAPDERTAFRGRYGGFERLRVDGRCRLLQASAVLLTGGAQSLTEYLQMSGLSSDAVWRFIRTQRVTAPYWLWRAVRDTVNHAMHTPTDEEIALAIRHVVALAAPQLPPMGQICHLLGFKNSYNPRVAAALRSLGLLGRSGRSRRHRLRQCLDLR